MWLPGTFLNQSSDTKIKVKIGQNIKIKSTVKGLRGGTNVKGMVLLFCLVSGVLSATLLVVASLGGGGRSITVSIPQLK